MLMRALVDYELLEYESMVGLSKQFLRLVDHADPFNFSSCFNTLRAWDYHDEDVVARVLARVQTSLGDGETWGKEDCARMYNALTYFGCADVDLLRRLISRPGVVCGHYEKGTCTRDDCMWVHDKQPKGRRGQQVGASSIAIRAIESSQRVNRTVVASKEEEVFAEAGEGLEAGRGWESAEMAAGKEPEVVQRTYEEPEEAYEDWEARQTPGQHDTVHSKTQVQSSTLQSMIQDEVSRQVAMAVDDMREQHEELSKEQRQQQEERTIDERKQQEERIKATRQQDENIAKEERQRWKWEEERLKDEIKKLETRLDAVSLMATENQVRYVCLSAICVNASLDYGRRWGGGSPPEYSHRADSELTITCLLAFQERLSAMETQPKSELELFLDTLGLGSYASVLLENEVDMAALPLMSGEDFKELGISMGASLKLVSASRS
jgi:hypothetical protein